MRELLPKVHHVPLHQAPDQGPLRLLRHAMEGHGQGKARVVEEAEEEHGRVHALEPLHQNPVVHPVHLGGLQLLLLLLLVVMVAGWGRGGVVVCGVVVVFMLLPLRLDLHGLLGLHGGGPLVHHDCACRGGGRGRRPRRADAGVAVPLGQGREGWRGGRRRCSVICRRLLRATARVHRDPAFRLPLLPLWGRGLLVARPLGGAGVPAQALALHHAPLARGVVEGVRHGCAGPLWWVGLCVSKGEEERKSSWFISLSE